MEVRERLGSVGRDGGYWQVSILTLSSISIFLWCFDCVTPTACGSISCFIGESHKMPLSQLGWGEGMREAGRRGEREKGEAEAL